MQAFQFAQKIISTLSLDPLLPGYSAITFAVADKTQGLLGAFVDSSGNLNIGGLKTSNLCKGSGGVDFSGFTGTFKTPTGLTTISGNVVFNSAGTVASPVAAAGSTQSNATQLTAASLQLVSSASSSNGWILPAAVPGYEITLINKGTTAGLVYPNSGNKINGGTANNPVHLLASKGATYYCANDGSWWAADFASQSS